jgi:uncharacterized protein involved in exopolysaccharide biosynthesis
VTYGVEERLAATSQKILSRTNLIAIIDELGLYREERNAIPEEVLAGKMRKKIDIDILKRKDAFVLSFEHEIPQIAMLTASKLASFFIDENLRVREQLAVGTSAFLETQLQEVKTRLEEQEEKVKQYKLTHMGELPQEMQANLNMLTRLQDQKRTNAEAIAKAEDRKVFLESQVITLQNQIRTLEGGTEDPTDLLIDELYAKQKQLEELSTKYTPNYPSIIALRREIEQLEKIIASNDPGSTGIDNSPKTNFSLRKRKTSREKAEVGRLNRQISSVELDIQALKREQLEIQRSSDAIQAKVARLPQREQEMISLTRDYDNLKESYEISLYYPTSRIGRRFWGLLFWRHSGWDSEVHSGWSFSIRNCGERRTSNISSICRSWQRFPSSRTHNMPGKISCAGRRFSAGSFPSCAR